MKVKKGDKVKVITGKDKGKIGIVQKVYTDKEKVLVENVNVVTKHVKPTRTSEGRVDKVNRPIHASNVMVMDPKNDEVTRIGYRFVDGKKYRVSKKSDEVLKS